MAENKEKHNTFPLKYLNFVPTDACAKCRFKKR